VFEPNGELKAEFLNLIGQSNHPKSIYSIASHSKGFVASGEGGSVIMYEREESSIVLQTGNSALKTGGAAPSEVVFKKGKEFTLSDENARVTNTALPQSEDMMIVTTDKNQIFSVALANTDIKVSKSRARVA
jgi:hypothetical protein